MRTLIGYACLHLWQEEIRCTFLAFPQCKGKVLCSLNFLPQKHTEERLTFNIKNNRIHIFVNHFLKYIKCWRKSFSMNSKIRKKHFIFTSLANLYSHSLHHNKFPLFSLTETLIIKSWLPHIFQKRVRNVKGLQVRCLLAILNFNDFKLFKWYNYLHR